MRLLQTLRGPVNRLGAQIAVDRIRGGHGQKLQDVIQILSGDVIVGKDMKFARGHRERPRWRIRKLYEHLVLGVLLCKAPRDIRARERVIRVVRIGRVEHAYLRDAAAELMGQVEGGVDKLLGYPVRFRGQLLAGHGQQARRENALDFRILCFFKKRQRDMDEAVEIQLRAGLHRGNSGQAKRAHLQRGRRS